MMKSMVIGGILMLSSQVAVAGDVFEIVSSKFKDTVTLEEQKAQMAQLNEIVSKFEGFKSRDYFYSEENGRWIDFIVWNDLNLAIAASKQAMNDPVARSIFMNIEENSMIFSHYQRVGGIESTP